MSCKCDYPLRTFAGMDVPVWGQTHLPDEGYLLMAAIRKDQTCGRDEPYLYHLPLRTLSPNGTFSNDYSLEGRGAAIVVPRNEVLAGYTYQSAPNDIRLATLEDSTYRRPQYLIIEADEAAAGSYIIQGTGVYTFPSSHKYLTGYTYFLGKDGKPTTDNSFINGKRVHLFEVIDIRTIIININEEQE